MGLIILLWMHYGYLHFEVPIWLWILGSLEWGIAIAKAMTD
jgi:hypothetical protein